jgi:hypothetical protein
VTDLRAAVAAGALGSEENYRELLQAVVEVARAIFASVVGLPRREDGRARVRGGRGEGAEEPVGRRFPSSTELPAGCWSRASRS